MEIILSNAGVEGSAMIHYFLEQYQSLLPLPHEKCNGVVPKGIMLPKTGAVFMSTNSEFEPKLLGEILALYKITHIICIVGVSKEMPHVLWEKYQKSQMPKEIISHKFIKPAGVIKFLQQTLDLPVSLAPV